MHLKSDHHKYMHAICLQYMCVMILGKIWKRFVQPVVGVIGCCILMDLKIRTKSSVIGSMIFKSVLKSCVIGLMIHKFYIKSSVIQSYGFTNIFDFIMDLNGFVWIF